MPANSTSGGMRYAGSMRNGWCISWTRSPTSTGPRRRGSAAGSGTSMPASRLISSNQPSANLWPSRPVRSHLSPLDRLLARLHANKAELLMVLDRPVDPLRGSTPLHTNGSENDIRCHVTRRKVSGGTPSDVGRDCRDAFLSLAKSCDKLGIAVWDYLGSRFKVARHALIEPLDHYVRARIRPA